MENTNRTLVNKFYTSFQNRDYKGMQECYADNAVFSDEVFVNLNASQVKSMWEMLCTRNKDSKLDFKNIEITDTHGTAEWSAYYTFSVTGRKVVNHVKSDFVFENGKIIKQKDVFHFYKWSKQALGTSALLLGWTSFFKNKVRRFAMKNLGDYMNKK
jgi:ketosteroid isomerase-like protein